MANEVKKAKADPAPKTEAVPKDKTASTESPAKTEGGDQPGVAPANYSRGEGQKPVTAAYKENWNLIFGKKNSKKKKKR
jgi:hypothetical protein